LGSQTLLREALWNSLAIPFKIRLLKGHEMESGVWEIFGMSYYTHGFGLIFVAPFAIWFGIALLLTLVRILRGKRPFISINLCLSAVMVFISFILVFWDVYQIGQQATKLCNKKAGLHVYRTAEAESVLGLSGIEHWSKYGFKFVEYEDVLKNKTRYFLDNGKPAYKKVDEFLSQYELVITRKNLTSKIKIHQYQIVYRSTYEVLGETSQLSIAGGWADMFFYGITGFSYSPWICKGDGMGDSSPIDIVKHVLKPINK
jgi:hypothetical protein